jgi:hypothetical protein
MEETLAADEVTRLGRKDWHRTNQSAEMIFYDRNRSTPNWSDRRYENRKILVGAATKKIAWAASSVTDETVAAKKWIRRRAPVQKSKNQNQSEDNAWPTRESGGATWLRTEQPRRKEKLGAWKTAARTQLEMTSRPQIESLLIRSKKQRVEQKRDLKI